MKPLIWKTHKHRGDPNCPHCGKPLRWIYDGENWLPVDPEPVLFTLHPDGKKTVVFSKTVYDHALVYRRGDKRFDGVAHEGLIQHWYTCPVLKKSREEYVARLMGVQ